MSDLLLKGSCNVIYYFKIKSFFLKVFHLVGEGFRSVCGLTQMDDQRSRCEHGQSVFIATCVLYCVKSVFYNNVNTYVCHALCGLIPSRPFLSSRACLCFVSVVT